MPKKFDRDILKNSRLLFEGKNFRNCGPARQMFCKDMIQVNDLISFEFNYTEIYTLNSSFEVGNLDDKYLDFVKQVKDIMGDKIDKISIYNKSLHLHELLYNPHNLPKGRIPQGPSMDMPLEDDKTRERARSTSFDTILAQHPLVERNVINKPWEELSTNEIKKLSNIGKNKLLEKFMSHFKEDKYCTLFKTTPLTDIRPSLFNKIMDVYTRAGIKPCVQIDNLIIKPATFNLYPEKEKREYIINNYQFIDLNDFLPYIDINTIPENILKYIANRYKSDFMRISWDNMTVSKFQKAPNPYLQLEYLKKYGPNYHMTSKWGNLYKSVTDKRILKDESYKSLISDLISLSNNIKLTKDIEKCISTKTINELVELAQKHFGGNKNTYLKMTHVALCDLINKKHTILQTPVRTKINYNTIDDYSKYKNLLKQQIEFVDSLDSKTKDALSRYTHQYDWQVNQYLAKDKHVVESLKHPNAVEREKFELDYGYEHVFNKNIKDVQRRLDAAFSHVPPLAHSMIVYRGIKYDKGDKYKHDSIYNKQYISTSTHIETAEDFLNGKSCCILHITLPQGSRVLPLKRLSHFQSEDEVLLPRDGKFVIQKQVGKNVYAIFNHIDPIKKPLTIFKTHVTSVTIRIKSPKHVHSLISGVMGPGVLINQWYTYTIKLNMPYNVKKLPFIIMLKKISKDYPETIIEYYIFTSEGRSKLIISNGNITENGKIVKFTGGIGGQVLDKK